MSDCTTYASPTVNTDGGVIAFTTGISEQDFIDNFGLVSPDIRLETAATESEIVVLNTLEHHEGPIRFEIVLRDGVLSYRFPVVGEPLTITILPAVEFLYIVEVIYKDVTTGQELKYNIFYLRDALKTADAKVCIPPIADNSVRLPTVKPDEKPNYAGFVYLTENLQYISQIDLEVQLAFNGCADGLVASTSKYVHYDFPLQCVMKGVGQSVKEKFDSIQAHCPKLVLNYEHFLQYSVLRAAITSQAECVPFSIELLRRRFEPSFRAYLLETKSKYYPWFYESSVAKYWKLFQF